MWCVVFLFEYPEGEDGIATTATRVYHTRAGALDSCPENCVVVHVEPGEDIDVVAREVAKREGVMPWKC